MFFKLYFSSILFLFLNKMPRYPINNLSVVAMTTFPYLHRHHHKLPTTSYHHHCHFTTLPFLAVEHNWKHPSSQQIKKKEVRNHHHFHCHQLKKPSHYHSNVLLLSNSKILLKQQMKLQNNKTNFNGIFWNCNHEFAFKVLIGWYQFLWPSINLIQLQNYTSNMR